MRGEEKKKGGEERKRTGEERKGRERKGKN